MRRGAVIASVWLLVLGAAMTPAWEVVESKGLDILSVLDPFLARDPRIVIVGIDDPSFAELRLQWPWPRDIHARLLEGLARAGASTVAFDVLFVETSDPVRDQRLADAIQRAPRVVLAADETVIEYTHASQRVRIEPLPVLLEAGAVPAVIRMPLDADQIIRRLPPARDAFWRVVAGLDAARRGERPPTVPDSGDLFLRWVHGDPPFPYASYYQALEPERFLPRDFFRDRIVLVGLNVQGSPEPGAKRADVFATPVFTLTGRLVPGVEIQAHALNTALRGRVLAAASPAVRFAAIVAVGAVAGVLFYRWRPLASALRAVALVAVVWSAAWVGYRFLDVFVPVLGIAAGVALTYGAAGAVAYLDERTLRRQMRDAFGRYVSPAIVEQIIANPGRLRLGGERKQVTVVFTDLAGFTTIAERLEPEEVVRVLNDHLTAVARIVIQSGGMVIKFLGDGMMALWGAPIEDRDHALHACRAAVAMQAAVAAFGGAGAESGLARLRMRVGVHSGDAIVGNMGTAERFDYTATGDTVNLASRLEGANKVYGTAILVSAATARLAAALPFRPVDVVRVKGKQEAIEVLTPETDAELIAATRAAIAAYRDQGWARAETLWREVLARRPDDAIAAYYLDRIAAFRVSPPPPGWDGVLTLETK